MASKQDGACQVSITNQERGKAGEVSCRIIMIMKDSET